MDARERLALLGLGVVLTVTASWWALALWPLPAESPAWLVRTRAVCFGATPQGLPDAAGWLALIGQPLLMLGTLRLVAGEALGSGLRSLRHGTAGRVTFLVGSAVLLAALALATWRVTSLRSATAATFEGPTLEAVSHARLDRAAPEIGLTDQNGGVLTIEMLEGRPALVTFAYANCATVCPVIVRDVLEAQQRLGTDVVAAVVVTLDPWRDTPARLPSIARRWALGENAFVLTGAVSDVTEVVALWDVPWQRDPSTGEITHPVVAYVLDAGGRIAFATAGGAETLVELVRRLAGDVAT